MNVNKYSGQIGDEEWRAGLSCGMGVRERGRFGNGALVRQGCLSARGGESGAVGVYRRSPQEEPEPVLGDPL